MVESRVEQMDLNERTNSCSSRSSKTHLNSAVLSVSSRLNQTQTSWDSRLNWLSRGFAFRKNCHLHPVVLQVFVSADKDAPLLRPYLSRICCLSCVKVCAHARAHAVHV